MQLEKRYHGPWEASSGSGGWGTEGWAYYAYCCLLLLSGGALDSCSRTLLPKPATSITKCLKITIGFALRHGIQLSVGLSLNQVSMTHSLPHRQLAAACRKPAALATVLGLTTNQMHEDIHAMHARKADLLPFSTRPILMLHKRAKASTL